MQPFDVWIVDDDSRDYACERIVAFAREHLGAEHVPSPFFGSPAQLAEHLRGLKPQDSPRFVLCFLDLLGPGDLDTATLSLRVMRESFLGEYMAVLLTNFDRPDLVGEPASFFTRWTDYGGGPFIAKKEIARDPTGILHLQALFAEAERRAESRALLDQYRSQAAGILGESQRIVELRRQIACVAPTEATVLLVGKSGTGKNVCAQALHNSSRRRAGPFVHTQLAALPAELIDSELFGYEKGAFTGAERSKPGKCALAAGGTLFLDEIGELTPQAQLKLLRLLQERTYEPLGGSAPQVLDARVIAATNRNLEQAVREGAFREDLYYRLHVFTIEVPPLCECPEDIPMLVEHFLAKIAGKHGLPPKTISDGALNVLKAYDWPGNVRELENAIESAFIRSREVVLPEDLDSRILGTRGSSRGFDAAASIDEERLVAELAFRNPPAAGSRPELPDWRKLNDVQLRPEEMTGVSAEKCNARREQVMRQFLVNCLERFGTDPERVRRICNRALPTISGYIARLSIPYRYDPQLRAWVHAGASATESQGA